MNSFLETLAKGIGKFLWSIFLYLFTSIFFMVLVMSFMSGKFPPPMKDLWAQAKDAKENFAKIMELQKKLAASSMAKVADASKNIGDLAPTTDSTAGGSNLSELAKDGLSKMKDHNRELEEAFAASGSDSAPRSGNASNSPAAQNSGPPPQTSQELQHLRFEVDVLKSQLAQARIDIENLKQNSGSANRPANSAAPAAMAPKTQAPAAAVYYKPAAQTIRQPTQQPTAIQTTAIKK